MTAVSWLLVDGRGLHADVVRHALADNDQVTLLATVNEPDTVLLQVERTQPQVVVLSTSIEGDPSALCVQVKDRFDHTRVLILDVIDDERSLLAAVEAGADGYLTEASGLDGLVDAIQALSRGESIIPPNMLGTLLRTLIQRRREASAASQKLERLTNREREVLRLLVDGLDHRDIAEQLFISPETARTHVQRILRKLEVHTRVEAIALVMHSGSLDELERMLEGQAS